MKKVISCRLIVLSVLISSALIAPPTHAQTWWEWFNKKNVALVSAGVGALAVGYWWLYGTKKKPHNGNTPSSSAPSHARSPGITPAEAKEKYVPRIQKKEYGTYKNADNDIPPTSDDQKKQIEEYQKELNTVLETTLDQEEIKRDQIKKNLESPIEDVEWGVSSEQGGEAEQQDTYSVDTTNPSLQFFAVFDGNGGTKVAEILKEDLKKIFFQQRRPGISTPVALKKTFHEMEKKLISYTTQGASATVFVIDGNKGYFAQLGDTKGYLLRNLKIEKKIISKRAERISEQIGDKQIIRRNVLTKFFGNNNDTEKTFEFFKTKNLPDIIEIELRINDIIILTTPGLKALDHRLEDNRLVENTATIENLIKTIQTQTKLNLEQWAKVLLINARNNNESLKIDPINATALIVKINNIPPALHPKEIFYDRAEPKRKGMKKTKEYRYTLYKQEGDLIFFGLYESHGDLKVTKIVRQQLYKKFFEYAKHMPIQTALSKSFEDLNKEIKVRYQKFEDDYKVTNTFDCSGSTALVYVIDTKNKKSYFANLGGLHAYFLTTDNKLNELTVEKPERIQPLSKKCSDKSILLNGAFGYYAYAPKLKDKPTVGSLELKGIKKIILLTSYTYDILKDWKGIVIKDILTTNPTPAQEIVKRVLTAKEFMKKETESVLIEKISALVITIN